MVNAGALVEVVSDALCKSVLMFYLWSLLLFPPFVWLLVPFSHCRCALDSMIHLISVKLIIKKVKSCHKKLLQTQKSIKLDLWCWTKILQTNDSSLSVLQLFCLVNSTMSITVGLLSSILISSVVGSFGIWSCFFVFILSYKLCFCFFFLPPQTFWSTFKPCIRASAPTISLSELLDLFIVICNWWH